MHIDAHQHFWHYDPSEHVWMTDEMGVLKRDYLPADVKPLLAESRIEGTVAVQARQNLDETAWLLELAAEHDFIKGVVGWIDLRSPEVDGQLTRFARQPRLVGVRHVVHDEPDDRFMLRAEFLRGLSRLQEHDLVYDLLLFPRHLPVAMEVVGQLPDQSFVLDHIAKPDIAAQCFSPWDRDLAGLASFPNVWCKLSGMVTEAAWESFSRDDFLPALERVLECFGPRRLMFGSDWPVCTLAASYREVLEIVTAFVGSLTPDEQAAILGGNARVCYGLE